MTVGSAITVAVDILENKTNTCYREFVSIRLGIKLKIQNTNAIETGIFYEFLDYVLIMLQRKQANGGKKCALRMTQVRGYVQ